MSVEDIFPPEALCECRHPWSLHVSWITACEHGECACEKFIPVRLAGGAFTPEEERAAYERAMRES